MYLLDTNVVSEVRKRKPHDAVLAWLEAAPESALHVSAVTLGEIQAGIEITREQDRAKAEEIETWLEELAQSLQVLPADAAVFRRWAKLMHGRPDHHLEDALIAATALVHGLTVVTRNTRDFKPFGVALVDPFRGSP
ncbi:type II toxin-antitoxin system VapC family toxin [Methylibium sp.]|uniref:type II toxin-antitoxin system VapC family toxin n=1 Tax=Methylibium sp. TaxID=2067992 RepID=UPI00181D622E|nr:type II toxin-antitoxin system VapC family toxin [Methylibium sp.]MBA3590061.1 type II toxin-antitoxin system VapC family toxin [Methylibium sp.]